MKRWSGETPSTRATAADASSAIGGDGLAHGHVSRIPRGDDLRVTRKKLQRRKCRCAVQE